MFCWICAAHGNCTLFCYMLCRSMRWKGSSVLKDRKENQEQVTMTLNIVEHKVQLEDLDHRWQHRHETIILRFWVNHSFLLTKFILFFRYRALEGNQLVGLQDVQGPQGFLEPQESVMMVAQVVLAHQVHLDPRDHYCQVHTDPHKVRNLHSHSQVKYILGAEGCRFEPDLFHVLI